MNKILLIEDNVDDIEFYSNLLSQDNSPYEVFVADRKEKVLNMFQSHSFHCILVDFNLPGWDGLKVIDTLNEASGMECLPIVILTGEHSRKNQAEAARRGALNYVIKDTLVTYEQIHSVIESTVRWSAELKRQNNYTKSPK
ncbi:MAG: response regulator [Pseudomonadota bacterium]